MCGIAGVFGVLDEFAVNCTARMNDAMVHRGPDQDGIWQCDGETGVVLGHRRLSILDVSDAGRQPMVDAASGVAIVFNGECYNFHELRAELEAAGRSFSSTSDTEVVLAAYVRWGRQSIDRLRGMFALAIWDPREQTLLLARDRLGIKPLYYFEGGGRLLFASELRALLASEAVPRKLDPLSLESFLWHGFVPGPRTIVDGVRLLDAGHVLCVRVGAVPELGRYWDYPKSVLDIDGGASSTAGQKLEEAVSQHLVSDVPLGIFLSGGVDSSVIAAIAQQASGGAVTTFNVRFEETHFDESPHARRIAGLLGTDHREVTLTEDYFADHLDDALACLDQPTFDALNTYFVSRAVKEAGLTVALAGTGGDELFGGYTSFLDLPRLRRLSGALGWLPPRVLKLAGRAASRAMMGAPSEVHHQTRWGKLADGLSTQGDLPGLYQVSYGLFTEEFLAALLLAPVRGTERGLTAERARTWSDRVQGEGELAAISSLEMASFLGERLLRDTDSASMAVSLEVRVPLLDHEFVEALARVSEAERFLPIGKKKMLRDFSREYLDPALFDRPKAGFELPLELWCRRLLADRLENTFHDINLAHAIGLNAESVGRLWRSFVKGGAGIYWSRVWSLYILMSWCRRHGVYL